MDEDGFSLLREWLSPYVEGENAAVRLPEETGIAGAFLSLLRAAQDAGARDLDISTYPDPVTGRLVVAEFSHAADGPDFTELKRLLDDGGWKPPSDDWTRTPAPLPAGPPGCVLTLWRTHAGGGTLETWLTPDGVAKIHVVAAAPGQRIVWYLPGPDPGRLADMFLHTLQTQAPRTALRIRIDGRPCEPDPTPPGALESCFLERPWGTCALYRLSQPVGEIRLFFRGILLQTQLCPHPFLHFDWDTHFRPDAGNCAEAVARDFEEAFSMISNGRPDAGAHGCRSKSCAAGCQEPRAPGHNPITNGASALEPEESTNSLLALWRAFVACDPRLPDSLHLVVLDDPRPERWPFFPLDPAVQVSPAQKNAYIQLPPCFPSARLRAAGRLDLPRAPALPWPPPRCLGLALNHPFTTHLFSLFSPPQAFYLLVRTLLWHCGLEPDENRLQQALDAATALYAKQKAGYGGRRQ